MSEKDTINQRGKSGTRKLWKVLYAILSADLLVLAFFAGLVDYLTLSEYKPQERESIEISPVYRDPIGEGQKLKVLTWNCGYGALGDNADFFMDGGKGVQTADKAQVFSNLQGIIESATALEPDVIFFQEVDRNSTRSHHIDEVIMLSNAYSTEEDQNYANAFAYNFNVRFVPYPLPPIGQVQSGLLTLTNTSAESAERIQLPCPFKWPVRLANLKRCLLLERIPLKNSDKYLVLINLHLEAYDSGEGKIAQTKLLKEVLDEEAAKGNYVIAGGDFNQTFSNTDSSAYPIQDGMWAPGRVDISEIGKSWQCLMDSRVPSCRSLDKPYKDADPNSFQYYVIDGFIVSSNVEVRSCETKDMGFVCTDHNPVLLECVLK